VVAEINSFSRNLVESLPPWPLRIRLITVESWPVRLLFRLFPAYSGNFPEAMNFGRLQDNNMRKYLAT
jgi:hypothetical protein